MHRVRGEHTAQVSLAEDQHPVNAIDLETHQLLQKTWRRAWTVGGQAALASRGAGGAVSKLDQAQLDRLVAELDRGPAVHGWTDQRWTLDRVGTLIGRLFRVSYTPRGVSYLLHRIGWTPQIPARRAIERDEDAIAAWRAQTWAKARG
jgi:putative transposase